MPDHSYRPLPTDGIELSWRHVESGSLELLELRWENGGWTASGIVGREQVQYVIRCTPEFAVTQFLLFRDLDDPDLWLASDGHGNWGEMNGALRDELNGCRHVELAVSPFPLVTPILHSAATIGPRIGTTLVERVLRIDVDTLDVFAVARRYTRSSSHRWSVRDHFDSAQGDGAVEELDFEVDDHGLPIDLADRFQRVGDTFHA